MSKWKVLYESSLERFVAEHNADFDKNWSVVAGDLNRLAQDFTDAIVSAPLSLRHVNGRVEFDCTLTMKLHYGLCADHERIIRYMKTVHTLDSEWTDHRFILFFTHKHV